jgi:hypothetical protein
LVGYAAGVSLTKGLKTAVDVTIKVAHVFMPWMLPGIMFLALIVSVAKHAVRQWI